MRLYPHVPEKLQFNEVLKRMLNRFADDLIANTQKRIDNAGIRSLRDVRTHPERLAAFSPAVDAERQATKDYLHQRVYFSPALADEKDNAERVITKLFTFWMEHPETLPSTYQEKAKGESLPRVVCDYIAGMTDHFTFEQFEKHCG